MPVLPLPDEPSLEQLRNQAKDLQRAVLAADPDALAEVAERFPDTPAPFPSGALQPDVRARERSPGAPLPCTRRPRTATWSWPGPCCGLAPTPTSATTGSTRPRSAGPATSVISRSSTCSNRSPHLTRKASQPPSPRTVRGVPHSQRSQPWRLALAGPADRASSFEQVCQGQPRYSGVDPWPVMNMNQTGSWAYPGRKTSRPGRTENRSV
jgi:hypothetical protein